MHQRFHRSAALCLVLCLTGCSTVKWFYASPATGEAWYITHRPLTGDEITYCRPADQGPAQCREVPVLDHPPVNPPPSPEQNGL